MMGIVAILAVAGLLALALSQAGHAPPEPRRCHCCDYRDE